MAIGLKHFIKCCIVNGPESELIMKQAQTSLVDLDVYLRVLLNWNQTTNGEEHVVPQLKVDLSSVPFLHSSLGLSATYFVE